MDEDIKIKETKLIEMTSAFCNTFLNKYYRDWAIRLVEDLANHPDNPLKRGKLEIWAASVLCAISQFTPMFDKYENPHSSIKELCYYFQVKEPTVYSKARTIMQLLELKKARKVLTLRSY